LEFTPDPTLRAAVHGIWWHAHKGAVAQRLVPDAFVEVCFQHGEASLEETPLPSVYVLGLQDAPLTLRSSGGLSVLGVRFHAWAGVQALALGAGVRADVTARVLEGLARERIPEAVATVQAWLISGVRVPEALPDLGRALYNSGGAVRVEDLAAALGVSSRQLERVCHALAGVPPKRLARLVRFQTAVRRLYDDPRQNLTALAFDLGFADQAHFIREFRAFAHATPGAFVSDLFNATAATLE
jgi:AraC-like DNA-binding protein